MPIIYYFPHQLFIIFLITPIIFLFSSFRMLVVWGWGLQIDKCSHNLPGLHC